MRIIHTSDWHLGARLCDKDRSDEHKQFLEWLLDLIKKESVDILLVSGDIFDSTNPPHYAETLYYNFLCSLKETSGCSAVITGGNHDSISKLDSPKKLLSHLSIYINGGIGESPELNIFPITNIKKQVIAIITAVPFLRERDIHVPLPGESPQKRDKAIIEGISTYYKNSSIAAVKERDHNKIPIIGMGHIFSVGSRSGLGERDLYVGSLGSVKAEIFPKEFSYTALGHIHRPQKVAGRDDIRYSGSPIHMEFGEKGDKEVLLADFSDDLLKIVTSVKVPVFRKLIRFRGSFNEICTEVDNFESPSIPFWVDAEVLGGDSTGDISNILNSKAEKKGFQFIRIRVSGIEGERIISTSNKVEIKDLSTEEVFLKRCQKAHLSETEINDLLPLYKELLINIHRDKNNED